MKQKNKILVISIGKFKYKLLLRIMPFNLLKSDENNSFYKFILDYVLKNLNLGGIILENNKIVFYNNIINEYTGYTDEEILNMTTLDFIHPDFIEIAKNKLISGSEVPYETWVQRKDKTIFPVLLFPKMITFNKRQFRVLIAKDLTHEKQFLEKDQLLSKTFEQSHESIVITDTDAKIIYINNKFCKLTGYSKEELIGKNPKLLKSGHHSDKFYVTLWNEISNGKTWQGEFQNKKKNGDIYWEKATISPIFNDEKKIISYLGIKEDITLQKEIELNFEETELQYTELINSVPLGIITIDTKGNIISINKNMLDYLGSPSIAETKKINILEFPLLKKYGISDKFRDAIESRKKIKFENEYTSLWGKSLFYRLYVNPVINSKNEILGAIAIAEDISTEKERERAILGAKNKAEETDRLKDIFLANMSHELRTPLNSIIGFNDLLKSSENLNNEQKEHIAIIENSATHLLSLINDLVDVSKLESKNLNFTLEKINFHTFIKDLMPVLNNQFKAYKKENLTFRLIPHKETESLYINVDKNRLTQIISNLVNNAIKYTNEGFVEVSCKTKNKELIICVKDTGIGIPEDKHEIVFERFRQVEESLSRQYGGTGLGLTLVKELVILMNGKIWFESEPGKGSAFYVSFPVLAESKFKNTKPEEEIPTVTRNEISKDKFTVLVVEDNIQNMLLISKILQDYNFNVLEAENGQEAVDVFKNNPKINVILMDIQMPIMNGIESTKLIRKIDPNIPIIAQTAFAFTEDKEKAFESGCNDIIIKPFKKDQLLFKVINNLKIN